jgi:hypothetical protein
MASGGSGDITSRGSTDMSSGGSRETKKYHRKAAALEWNVYDDHTQKTWKGWERVAQPWSTKIAMQYVGHPHFDRLWPRPCHEVHCRSISANYNQLEDVEIKWKFLIILRNISILERWPKGAIPKSVTCLMYAKHVLRVRVDWSRLGALKKKKFGGIGAACTKYTVPDIPYIFHIRLVNWRTRIQLNAIVERKNMRTCILFAMAKVRQFEAEFESIQKE